MGGVRKTQKNISDKRNVQIHMDKTQKRTDYGLLKGKQAIWKGQSNGSQPANTTDPGP